MSDDRKPAPISLHLSMSRLLPGYRFPKATGANIPPEFLKGVVIGPYVSQPKETEHD